MNIIRTLTVLAGLVAFAAPTFAQSAGDKATGQGSTNGQQGPSTDTSSGSSGSGQK